MGIKRYYETTKRLPGTTLLEELKIKDEEACYVGDEVIDLGVMRRVGFAVAFNAKKTGYGSCPLDY